MRKNVFPVVYGLMLSAGCFFVHQFPNPKSKIGNPKSLDHLIRPIQHRLRDRQADLLGRLEIDHQLELRRLLDRQIGRLGSLQDFVHVGYATRR